MERSTTDITPAAQSQVDSILVIDDDKDWCFIATMMLQRAGFDKQIITANHGLEGIKTLKTISAKGEKLPDIIFLDIKMPVMDGFEFLEEITKTAEVDLSHTRIFICSSSFHSKDKEKAHLYPIAGFITKPLTIDILKEVLM